MAINSETPDPREQPSPPASARSNGPAFAEPEPRVRDLSAEIVKLLARARDERVTCRWISGNNYRCNWWGPQKTAGYDNPGMGGLMVTTHRVRRSQWLRAVKTDSGLVMEPAQHLSQQRRSA